MLYKHKGPDTDPGNYRPISLINTDVKLLTKFLNDQAMRHASEWIGQEQQGFLPDRWIHNNTRFMLDFLCGLRRIEFQRAAHITTKGLVILLLDFKKAFDSVSWNYASQVVHQLSPSSPYLEAIMDSLYLPHTTQVLGRSDSTSFFLPVTQGVKQGDPASPLIFDLAIEELFKQLRLADTDGLTIGGVVIKAQGYADDTNLFDTMATLAHTIEILLTWSAASGVAINFAKSIALLIPPSASHRHLIAPAQTLLEGHGFECKIWSLNEDVNLGKYLGIPLHTKPCLGRSAWEAALHIQLTKAAGKSLRVQQLHSTDINLRARVANQMLSSIPIYGMGVIPPRVRFIHSWQRQVNKLVFGHRVFRPSDVKCSLPVGEGGINLASPQMLAVAIAVYSLHKFLTGPTPDWVFAPVLLLWKHKPTWWVYAIRCCVTIGLLPEGMSQTISLSNLRRILQRLSHDDLYDRVRLWWYRTHVTPVPLFARYPCSPQSLREWWRLPAPARIRDFGYLVIWGKNQGGLNSYRHPRRCIACNSDTDDPWHFATGCTVALKLVEELKKVHRMQWGQEESALHIWSRALQRHGAVLSRDEAHMIWASYLLYTTWWLVHQTGEGCPSEQRKQQVLLLIPRLAALLHRHRYQLLLNLLTEETQLYTAQEEIHQAQQELEEH
jgi:hypothetical protein